MPRRFEPQAMAAPTLADVRALAGDRVRLVVPKPREDQRLVGDIEVGDGTIRLLVDAAAAHTERFRTIELRERERDGVLRAYRSDGSLIGRVASVEPVEENAE